MYDHKEKTTKKERNFLEMLWKILYQKENVDERKMYAKNMITRKYAGKKVKEIDK